jgi:8-oxo-dGTP pyrophosphatase MutT (NUDIX family)
MKSSSTKDIIRYMIISKTKPENFNDNDCISCIYVFCNDEFLILQYSQKGPKDNHLIGKWGIVSGKNEKSENKRECAIRELMEETGIRADIKDLEEIGLYYYLGNVNRVVYDFILKVDKKPNIKLSKEHKDYKWVTKENIDKYPLVRGREEIINKFKPLNF